MAGDEQAPWHILFSSRFGWLRHKCGVIEPVEPGVRTPGGPDLDDELVHGTSDDNERCFVLDKLSCVRTAHS